MCCAWQAAVIICHTCVVSLCQGTRSDNTWTCKNEVERAQAPTNEYPISTRKHAATQVSGGCRFHCLTDTRRSHSTLWNTSKPRHTRMSGFEPREVNHKVQDTDSVRRRPKCRRKPNRRVEKSFFQRPTGGGADKFVLRVSNPTPLLEVGKALREYMDFTRSQGLRLPTAADDRLIASYLCFLHAREPARIPWKPKVNLGPSITQSQHKNTSTHEAAHHSPPTAFCALLWGVKITTSTLGTEPNAPEHWNMILPDCGAIIRKQHFARHFIIDQFREPVRPSNTRPEISGQSKASHTTALRFTKHPSTRDPRPISANPSLEPLEEFEIGGFCAPAELAVRECDILASMLNIPSVIVPDRCSPPTVN